MNKAMKGALAAAAGAAILAGGAGTMAAWNASDDLGGGTVTAGQLNLETVGTGTWNWVNANGTTGGTFNAQTAKLVPGDKVRYTASYAITFVGDNLKATLTPGIGGVSGDLAPFLDAAPASGGTGVPVTSADNGTTKTVSTDITFKANTGNKDGQTLSADLSSATVTLQQTS